MRGTPVTTTLDPEDYMFVSKLAKAWGYSKSSIIAAMVKEHIEDQIRILEEKQQKGRK